MAKYRVKCACGEVLNIQADQPCTKCGKPLSTEAEGKLQIYRMGSPIGAAAGFGIYLNGQPYGHLANKENICVLLPYGKYTVHFTCGMNRRGKDAVIELTPESPEAYVKAAMKSGFWSNTLIANISTKEEMPPLE